MTLDPDEAAFADLFEQRIDEDANTAQCKFCGKRIIWKRKVYNSFGHFWMIPVNPDGTEHSTTCKDKGKLTVRKLEDGE